MLKQILAAENLNQPNLNAETENLSDITEDNGLLFVKVVHCSNFLIPHEKECTGLYAIISLEKQELRTSTLEIVTSPDQKKTVEWNQDCALDVTQPEATLAITVFAKYPRTSLAIGKITLPISQLRRELIEAKYVLRLRRVDDSSLELAPELHLTVRFMHMQNKVGPDDFEILAVVGKGSFGKVFQVRKKDTGNIFAMKVIRKDNVVKRNAVEHTMAENKILKHINHPFLVNLKYAFQTKLHLYMVIDYLNGGELFLHLTRDDYFSEERTRFYTAEVVLALGYLHDNNIVYRDLKPENLLLDMQGHICLVDFGLCKTGLGFDTKTHTFCGSPEYIAPEVLRGEGYNKEVDWWALGTLIFEMLTGLPPFWSEDEDVMHNKIQYAPLQFPSNFSEAVKDLLRCLLNRNPKKRLGTGLDGTEDIKKHPWFASLNWRKLYNREAEPPFKPHIVRLSNDLLALLTRVQTNMLDLNYFDEEFTREAPQLSYTGTPGFKFDQDIFSGFSYNGESEMRNFGEHPMPPSSLSRNGKMSSCHGYADTCHSGTLERRRRFSSANPPPPNSSANSRLKIAVTNSYKSGADLMESETDFDESLEDTMVRLNSLPRDTMSITPTSVGNSFANKSPQHFVQGRVASNNFQRPNKLQPPPRKLLIGVSKEAPSPREDLDDMSEDDFDDEGNHTPSSQSNLMFALE